MSGKTQLNKSSCKIINMYVCMYVCTIYYIVIYLCICETQELIHEYDNSYRESIPVNGLFLNPKIYVRRLSDKMDHTKINFVHRKSFLF